MFTNCPDKRLVIVNGSQNDNYDRFFNIEPLVIGEICRVFELKISLVHLTTLLYAIAVLVNKDVQVAKTHL